MKKACMLTCWRVNTPSGASDKRHEVILVGEMPIGLNGKSLRRSPV